MHDIQGYCCVSHRKVVSCLWAETNVLELVEFWMYDF